MIGESYIAISNLVARYYELLDEGDFVSLAKLLAHAEVVFLSEAGIRTLRGEDELFEFFVSAIKVYGEHRLPVTRHVGANLIVDIDETAGSAMARSTNVVFQHVEGKLPLQPIGCTSFSDRFERSDGEWRFVHRSIRSEFATDLSYHIHM